MRDKRRVPHRWPLVWATSILYGVLVAPTLLAMSAKPLQFMIVLGFVWPYPFLLCFQRFGGVGSFGAWLAAILFGFLLVLAFASYVQRLVGRYRPAAAVSWFLSVLLVAVPLVLATLIAYSVAAAKGWATGE